MALSEYLSHLRAPFSGRSSTSKGLSVNSLNSGRSMNPCASEYLNRPGFPRHLFALK